MPCAALADTVRIATYNAGLSRKGPGLLLQDIWTRDAQVLAAAAMVGATDADVILLTDVDWDLNLTALAAFNDLLDAPYPHVFARLPNSGMATGLDLNLDGQRGGPDDAQGFGFFSGDGGMAVLSRYPIGAVRDFSDVLWADLPDALLFDGMTEDARAVQRLSSTAHWEVEVILPSGPLRLLAFHATPPVFDGPEDRNGRRNHDEIVFWADLIEGRLPFPPPDGPFVILGDANADPVRGDGLRAGIDRLLTHPALQDPEALTDRPTAEYDSAGPLRVDYILPQAGLTVTGAGLIDGPLAREASSHWPIWVEIDRP
ncbi:endonuclease/exonuclease/phosphatase family protein [Falsirhodobacter halotolerans]|uniref:endonuclease/exonuclease/phosphatase family protein n=1 Tax=Falsirhodobacter halotolerans TaxID=1146892 RepID=UPI001FCF949F|nr:endonuclease/exonuclease/phosphatase family protein [Falsirhodobacter halotolerans]MCJ8140679.1 endonuclease/exonuclease/phosphatase family protein [Falsirhodobacter halotolerans]